MPVKAHQFPDSALLKKVCFYGQRSDIQKNPQVQMQGDEASGWIREDPWKEIRAAYGNRYFLFRKRVSDVSLSLRLWKGYNRLLQQSHQWKNEKLRLSDETEQDEA